MNIVLASSSQYRANLLKQVGINANLIAPNIDEAACAGEDPKSLSQRLSLAKANAVVSQLADSNKLFDDTLIIGSDQVACCNNMLLGKPGTKDRAIEQLSFQAGQTVEFFTSLVIVNASEKSLYTYTDQTSVVFRQLSISEITAYVEREVPTDCAGSFKVEGLGITLMQSIISNDPSALIGLPLIGLNLGLIEFGYNTLLARN
ncbi:MAG: nucleoside triphosphate pyrophosphatase [Kangiellaceae bacterium]|jgi:MAF protein|nr:nucleoside triphosphate pyrophosphatase [Kangiellaceae bacterium]